MKIKKIGQKIVSYTDLFATPIEIYIKGESKHSTIIGSITSIFIITFLSLSTYYLIMDMVTKKNPNLISNTLFSPNPSVTPLLSYSKAFNFTYDQHIFMIAITDQETIPIINLPNYAIYTITAEVCIRRIDEKTNQLINYCESYRTKNCSNVYVNDQLRSIINPQTLSYSYCLDDEQWKEKPIQIQGKASSTVFDRIRFRIQQCVNGTNENYVCAPQSIIDKKLARSYQGIVFADTVMNQKQEGSPYNKITKLLTKPVSLYSFSNMLVYMNHVETESEENYFYYFPKIHIYKDLQFDRFEADTDNNISHGLFSQIVILLDEKTIKSYRYYDNIMSIFGAIGGLFEFLFLVGKIINHPYSKFSRHFLLIGEIFCFDGFTKQQEMREFKRRQVRSSRQIFPRSNRESSIIFLRQLSKSYPKSPTKRQIQGNQQKGLESLKVYLKQKRSKIDHGFVNVVRAICSKEKRRNYSQGVEVLEKKMNILFILKKLLDIEKLKIILLNEKQRNLFEYLPKPEIYSNNDNFDINNQAQMNLFQDQKDYLQQGLDTLSSYSALIKSSQGLSDIDLRLIKYLDADIKSFFDEAINEESYKEVEKEEQNRMNLANNGSIVQFEEYNM